MAGGTTQWVAGSGDTRLLALQATYNGASSFTISAATLQVNLGGGGTVYDQNTSPRVNAGDSIWLGTFEVTAPVPWNAGTSSNPAWVIGTPTSISVYDVPPTVTTATVCNSTGTGLSTSSGQLQNGIVSVANPSGAGQPPCSLLLNGCAFAAGSPSASPSLCGNSASGSVSVSVTGTNGNITYTLNPGAIVIGPTSSTSVTFNGVAPGSYTVTYQDGVGPTQDVGAQIEIGNGNGSTRRWALATVPRFERRSGHIVKMHVAHSALAVASRAECHVDAYDVGRTSTAVGPAKSVGKGVARGVSVVPAAITEPLPSDEKARVDVVGLLAEVPDGRGSRRAPRVASHGVRAFANPRVAGVGLRAGTSVAAHVGIVVGKNA